MKAFKEFAARLIVFSVITGIIIGFSKALNALLPSWAILVTIILSVVLISIPPRYKYFLFMVQDGDGKDYVVIARDREEVPIQRVLDVVDDCRIRDFTRIKKAQYKAFKKRAEINKNEYFILD